MKNILILGGGGFIGSNLCRLFSERGFRLRVAGRSPPRLTVANVEFVPTLLGASTDFSALLDGQDAVVHMLSTTTPATSNQDMHRDVTDNLLPTIALLDACRRAAVKRMVFISSGGTIYGPDAVVPTPETAPNEPISSYGIVKLAIEKYMHLYEREGGSKAFSLRVANPFGPMQDAGKGQGVIAAFARRMQDGDRLTIFGDGSVRREFGRASCRERVLYTV